MSRTEWAAGFVEGEGYFYAGKANKQGNEVITLGCAQKEVEPLQRLQKLFGGSLSLAKRNNIHYWSVSGYNAVHAMKCIYPFMSSRRKQQIDESIEKFFKLKNERLATKVCPECGTEFKPKTKAKIYCSKSCISKRQYRKHSHSG